jgi:hypothetical protein
VLDVEGKYDEAFGHFQAANDLQKKQLTKERGFDARSHQTFVDQLIADFGRPYFERVKKWGTRTDLPLFIVGMPRSGSTLVGQILASHPKVFGGGDIGNVYKFVAQNAADKNASPAQMLPNVRAARTLAADYCQRLANLGKGAARVTVAELENYLALGLIATLFPGARVIHCRRDSVDICLSCYFHYLPNLAYACSLEEIGAYYRAYEKLMAHWSRVLPLTIHDISYEELIQNQEPTSRKLLSFCGLDWDERCLTFWNTRRVIHTASALQARMPLFTRSVGRWRHYRSHLDPLFKVLEMAAPADKQT